MHQLDHSDARLANISTRGFVGTNDDVITTGVDPASILVRAFDPSLAQFGIQDPLADPTLELFDAQGTELAANDDWKTTQQSQIETTKLAPPNELEAAILGPLLPGNYTAVVRGADAGTGVALIEVYNL